MTQAERCRLAARAQRPGIPRAELEAVAAVLGAGAYRPRMLRRAHAQVYRLRQVGETVPFWLRVL